MKRVWEILIFALIVASLFLFKPRQDMVFAAIDGSQYIRLFEEGRDFVLCVDENNIFTGTYTLSEDTVSLLYLDHVDLSTNRRNTPGPEFNWILPTILIINQSASTIQSGDGASFSARIYADMRNKSNQDMSQTARNVTEQITIGFPDGLTAP